MKPHWRNYPIEVNQVLRIPNTVAFVKEPVDDKILTVVEKFVARRLSHVHYTELKMENNGKVRRFRIHKAFPEMCR